MMGYVSTLIRIQSAFENAGISDGHFFVAPQIVHCIFRVIL